MSGTTTPLSLVKQMVSGGFDLEQTRLTLTNVDPAQFGLGISVSSSKLSMIVPWTFKEPIVQILDHYDKTGTLPCEDLPTESHSSSQPAPSSKSTALNINAPGFSPPPRTIEDRLRLAEEQAAHWRQRWEQEVVDDQQKQQAVRSLMSMYKHSKTNLDNKTIELDNKTIELDNKTIELDNKTIELDAAKKKIIELVEISKSTTEENIVLKKNILGYQKKIQDLQLEITSLLQQITTLQRDEIKRHKEGSPDVNALQSEIEKLRVLLQTEKDLVSAYKERNDILTLQLRQKNSTANGEDSDVVKELKNIILHQKQELFDVKAAKNRQKQRFENQIFRLQNLDPSQPRSQKDKDPSLPQPTQNPKHTISTKTARSSDKLSSSHREPIQKSESKAQELKALHPKRDSHRAQTKLSHILGSPAHAEENENIQLNFFYDSDHDIAKQNSAFSDDED